MSTCLLKRGLPFLLTFLIGAGASMLLQPREHRRMPGVGESRTYGWSYSRGYGCGRGAYRSAGVQVRPYILSKPEPLYTEEARMHRTNGTVILSAVLTADGDVEGIDVVQGLPDGLTERATEAARQIIFTPAMNNGTAVSQRVQISYDFEL
jgi:TonB family protein